ncbi:hypothetical protein [Rhodopirellula baltica]|uniref:hypothetical protein n=1 Tax=Rhodopirellula baltica TaxID=265606 RepID=UPI001F2DF809|nr:hypothetical protein [Rhodopirellula baltica]
MPFPGVVDHGSQSQQNKYANELINRSKDEIEPALGIIVHRAKRIDAQHAAADKSDHDHETRSPKPEASAGKPDQQVRRSEQSTNHQGKD